MCEISGLRGTDVACCLSDVASGRKCVCARVPGSGKGTMEGKKNVQGWAGKEESLVEDTYHGR